MQADMLVLGNLALDDVVYEDGTTRMAQPGGATLYVALGARLWGIGVGIVSRVGEDYPSGILDRLSQQGIDLAGVRPLGGPGLRTWLLYEGQLRRVVHRLEGPSHEEASPDVQDLPTGWNGRAAHLAPMPLAVQHRLVEALADRDGLMLSLDPYELLSADDPVAWRPLLAGIDIFFLSQDEMTSAEARCDPRAALPPLAGGRLRLILFKQGARGGVVYDAGRRRFFEWSSRVLEVADPTGAGDAFAGGVLAGLLLGDELPRALQRGVVASSFALEGLGAEVLLQASAEAARLRLVEWFGP